MSDYLDFVVPCTCCRERWCTLCDQHWADCACPGPHANNDEVDMDDVPSTRSLIIDTSRIRGGHVANLLWMVTAPGFDPVALEIEVPVVLRVKILRLFTDGGIMLDRYSFEKPMAHPFVQIKADRTETIDNTLVQWCVDNGVCPARIRQ